MLGRATALVLLLAGCDPASSPDASVPALPDAGFDAGASDGGAPGDAGLDAGSDGGSTDGGADAGASGAVGSIAGTCGVLDDELLAPAPFLFENALDFGPTALVEADLVRLSAGAQEILAEGTVGGSSEYSEAIAFEVLHRCEGAALLASESEILYDDPMGTRTDLLVELDGHRVGVSVTRAMGFPRDAPYPVEQALTLLERKLEDILASTANVADAHLWVKQVLHVVAYSPMHAESMRMAWDMVDAATRADTILWITVTDGEDAFIYDNAL